MKLMMIDLDGTLFDTKKVNYLAYMEAMQVYGYKIDYEYYCKFCNGKHYMDFLPQISTNDKEILQKIHENKKKIYNKYLNEARLNEKLVDLIRISRVEYKTALVTTASKKNTYDILELAYLANETRETEEKNKFLSQIIAKIKIIDFLLNLSYDKMLINSKKYVKLGEKIDDIIKYVVGWKNSINQEKRA